MISELKTNIFNSQNTINKAEMSINFLHLSKDLIWETDRDHVYTYVNPRVYQILGYRADELIGHHAWEFCFDDDISGFKEFLKRSHSPVDTFQRRFRHKDGHEIFVETNCATITDEKGSVIGCQGIDRDCTDRKRSETALRQSEETLRSVLRAAPIGIGVVTDRVFNWVNDRICEMVQYSQNELSGQSARILYASDEAYTFVGKEKYGQIARCGTGTVETQWVRKDGSIIDVLLSSTPLDVSDLSKGVTFTALDITGRKQAVRELENARTLLHSSIEQSSSGIIIADAPDVHIRLVNSAALAILGIEEKTTTDLSSAARTMNWNTFWPDGTPCSEGDFPLTKAIREGIITRNVEVLIRRDPEQKRWVLINAAPVRTIGGTIIAGTLVFTDITELKRSEAELKKLKNNLEEEVSKKTQELIDAQERLIKTERLAAMGQLAGTVAHEFRNQLGVMRNVVYLLKIRYKQADEKTHKHLQILEEQIVTTDRIIENILTFARFKKPDFTQVHIGELLSIVINKIRLRQGLHSQDVSIVTEVDPSSESIEADRIQMIQIFDNLINNALEAVEDDGHILIASRKDNDRIIFTVSDDGCGMSQDIQEKVFDPLFTTKARGAGLGLSTVKIMIEAHGGDIDVMSEDAHGTEISFSLPIRQTV